MERTTLDPVSDAVSRLRGLYARVAARTGFDPSYISRIARKERRSAHVEAELRREFRAVLRTLRHSGRALSK